MTKCHTAKLRSFRKRAEVDFISRHEDQLVLPQRYLLFFILIERGVNFMFAECPGNHLEVLEALPQIGVPNLRKRSEELQAQGAFPRGTSWVSRHM